MEDLLRQHAEVCYPERNLASVYVPMRFDRRSMRQCAAETGL